MRDTIKAVYSDGGRFDSKRPKQKNDCTVRALATAASMSYDEAYEALAAAGRKCNARFQLERYTRQHPQQFEWLAFPAQMGIPRKTVGAFINEYRSGRYIVRVSKHVFAVIDGQVIDDAKEIRANRCVYGAWRIKAPAAHSDARALAAEVRALPGVVSVQTQGGRNDGTEPIECVITGKDGTWLRVNGPNPFDTVRKACAEWRAGRRTRTRTVDEDYRLPKPAPHTKDVIEP